MESKLVKVLKSDQVLVSGTARLDIGGGIAPVRTATSGQAASHAGFAAQQARIIESNDEYAVIEVTCSCGAKTHVQCNYSRPAEATQSQPNGEQKTGDSA